jgi:hypothetical protein
MKIRELWGLPLASLLPGVGTSVYIASKLYSKRKDSSPELPEEVLRQNRKRFEEFRDFWIITGLLFLLTLIVKRAYYYNHQTELLLNHNTEQVVTKQKNL